MSSKAASASSSATGAGAGPLGVEARHRLGDGALGGGGRRGGLAHGDGRDDMRDDGRGLVRLGGRRVRHRRLGDGLCGRDGLGRRERLGLDEGLGLGGALGGDLRHHLGDLPGLGVRLRGAGAGLGPQALGHLGDALLRGGDLHRRLGELLVDAGGDDRDADHALERMVEGGAQDDVRLRIDLFADAGRRLVHLVEGEVGAAGDRDEQPAGALHRDVVEQRVGDRRLGGLLRATVARGLAGAHHRLAHAAHDRAHVGEVEVDQAFLDHQVGDAGHARVEHLVRHREGVGEGGALVGDPEEVSGWG